MKEEDNQIIQKNTLDHLKLKNTPAKLFIENLNLSLEEKALIENQKRDGWLISLIDSLSFEYQNILDSALMAKKMSHYISHQINWIEKDIYLRQKALQRELTPQEKANFYCGKKGQWSNAVRYKIAYILIFPQLSKLKEQSKDDSMKIFLEKADEIIKLNYQLYSYPGLIDYARDYLILKGQLTSPFYETILTIN